MWPSEILRVPILKTCPMNSNSKSYLTGSTGLDFEIILALLTCTFWYDVWCNLFTKRAPAYPTWGGVDRGTICYMRNHIEHRMNIEWRRTSHLWRHRRNMYLMSPRLKSWDHPPDILSETFAVHFFRRSWPSVSRKFLVGTAHLQVGLPRSTQISRPFNRSHAIKKNRRARGAPKRRPRSWHGGPNTRTPEHPNAEQPSARITEPPNNRTPEQPNAISYPAPVPGKFNWCAYRLHAIHNNRRAQLQLGPEHPPPMQLRNASPGRIQQVCFFSPSLLSRIQINLRSHNSGLCKE